MLIVEQGCEVGKGYCSVYGNVTGTYIERRLSISFPAQYAHCMLCNVLMMMQRTLLQVMIIVICCYLPD